MRCEICGREYSEESKIVEWLGHQICIYCMGYGKERTKRGPPKPPKPPKPEEKKPPGIPPEYRRPPEIEKEAWEIEEEIREAGPPPTPAPEAPKEEKGLVERIVDAIRSAFGAAAEAIKEVVRKVREWFK